MRVSIMFTLRFVGFIPKLLQDAYFRAIAVLSLLGANAQQCRLTFKRIQRSSGTAVERLKGMIKTPVYWANLPSGEHHHTSARLSCLKAFLLTLKSSLLKILGYTAIGVLISGCATSPTGRSQLLLASPQQLDQMGQQAFAAMKSDLQVSSRRLENRYVQCVTDALIPHVPANTFSGNWEVVVFDNEQVNAFALPGGKIGVYTGLLRVAQNDDQLAAVIGHEIGHVIAQHSNERMSQGQLINMGSQAINAVLENKQVAQNREIMAVIGLGMQFGVQLPFSRAHETEADIIGLVLMAKAGFDPRQSIELWKNMNAASKGDKPPELLSTHPSANTRIQTLQANMPAAMADYNATSQRPSCS